MRQKENYAMKKLAVPKRVVLPDGRTFFARYKRIKRRELPAEIQMKRTYKQRPAPRGQRRRRRVNQQQGQGFFDFTKKIVKNPIFKAIAKKGLENAPELYQKATKRIKNKTLKKILESDLAQIGLSRAIEAGNRLAS